MGRILFFILLAVLAYVFFQRWKASRFPQKRIEKKPSQTVQKIVPCPVCGVHFIEPEGVWVNNHMVCSEACAKKERTQ